ncbi:hypothetical protein HMPREF3107_02500 [Neisseria sp. HMSC31F04]|uniref:hypothetical protein n=1 Tax=Neisseria sp. HMSC31F04 TaxID=1581075 RepID=UPI0008B1E4B5|nr:hypothetical protein [Neisseria sp. HMSC31F04]OFT02864.1 hypothetical protein HMPREF3107_02500 [Neisseria sp. HMSC31F04]
MKTSSYDADCLTRFSDGLNLRPYGEYWFFAENSKCPEDLLQILADHSTRTAADERPSENT